MSISAAQLDAFARDGYLVVEGFATARACAELRSRARAIVDELAPRAPRSIFSARSARAGAQVHHRDRHFLDSGDAIRCFYEEDAFDDDGALRVPLAEAINKIGHALHELDPVFAAFSRGPEVRALIGALGLVRPVALQSMYIFKQPRVGGEVAYHQDATYLYTEPSSVVGLWWALEDATVDNGCLRVWPGGQRTELAARFVRGDDDTVRYQRPAGGAVDPSTWPPRWPAERFVPLEVPEGTLVLLDGLLPHGSGPNRTSRSRHAYSLHFIDGACTYPADNWLRRARSAG